MNPSHFPQVTRVRSRSPSPVSRRRVCSDCDRECLHGINATGSENSNFLTVPGDGRRRSLSDRPRLTPHLRNQPRGRTAELKNMANVEAIVNARRTASFDGDADLRHHTELHCQSNSINTDHDDHWPHHSEGHTPLVQEASGNHTCYGSTGTIPCDSGSSTNLYTPGMEDCLRRRLKFFFMDPCSKFKARHHWPWKLTLQIFKIIIITVQLVIFGAQRSDVVEYFERHDIALKHLLLKDWDVSFETMPYPPATGTYAIYSKENFYDAIDFAWEGYYTLPSTSVVTVNLIKIQNETLPVTLCTRSNNYMEFPNGTYIVEAGTLSNCTDLVPTLNSSGDPQYEIRDFLKENNMRLEFPRLLDLELKFSFTTFRLNLIETHYGPSCYRVNSTITFTNYERSGQILIKMNNDMREKECPGKIMSPGAADEENSVKLKNTLYDVFVMLICIFSSILCARSLYRAWQLEQKTDKFFKMRFGKGLGMYDKMEFINLWYLLIILNDVITIIGTAYKIQLENRQFTLTYNNYDICSVFLGLGGLFAWIGCLRYLGFFKKYNILILTLKTAFPNVLRFSVCALAMYFGFMFCGWVILSPYHLKFRHISTASECLYSLVNGDDMFVTFSATVTDNTVIWYFSRIYLYIFISLFIYCVLSLFISVIMDTYETLKEYYENGFPKSDMQKFIEECNDPIQSGLYRRQHTEMEAECSLFNFLCCCNCKRKPNADRNPEERERLLTRTI